MNRTDRDPCLPEANNKKKKQNRSAQAVLRAKEKNEAGKG